MKQTIEAKEQELKRIFSDDYLFEIPAYQRPYAWTTEQTSELLDDLMAAMIGDGPIDEASPYFMGSIVLIKDPTQALAQVVDGQQRLTTLTILFSVLRELAETENARNSLDKYVCEKGDEYAGSEDRYRLSLRARDRDFFNEKIQKMGSLRSFLDQDKASFSDSKKRIFENTQYLWGKLSTVDQKIRDRLTKYLIQRCFLVVVSASDQSSAYRIFSVMNDRGLDLSPTDILKADIIGAMPEDIRQKYTDQWEEIEEETGRDGFRDLFAHIRMIYAKDKLRSNLPEAFRKTVLSKDNGREFVDDVLSPYSEVFGIVTQAAYESIADAENVNSYLRHLGRLDNFDWLPPAISFFKMHRNDHQSLAMFTKDLERLAYGLFVQRVNINDRIKRYADVLSGIERDDDLFAGRSPLQLSQEETAAILEALNGPIYLQTRLRMPLLLRLDSLLADQGATYEHKLLSIEHVLPQSPAENSTWLNWFPDADTRDLWTHRLANLVLLSRRKNAQAQNFDFDRKKEEYFQKKGVATFAITSQVLIKNEWSEPVLIKRQEELLGLLKDEWRLGTDTK